MDSPSRPAQGFTLLDIKIVKKKYFLINYIYHNMEVAPTCCCLLGGMKYLR